MSFFRADLERKILTSDIIMGKVSLRYKWGWDFSIPYVALSILPVYFLHTLTTFSLN